MGDGNVVNNLIVVLAAVATLVSTVASIVKKNKEKAEAKTLSSADERVVPQERVIRPSSDGQPEEGGASVKKVKQTTGREREVVAPAQKSVATSTGRYTATVGTFAASAQKPGIASTADKGRGVAFGAANEEDVSNIAQGFDLEKAVVWMEILKPKFEEE